MKDKIIDSLIDAERQEREYEETLNKNLVTEEAYSAAILRLINLSKSDGSASEVAAQILLSTYNSYNWHAPLAWFCHLDALNFDAALTVIKGRVLLFSEPHNMIPNGNDVFEDLKQRWPNLPTQV